jgi:hypothetical protein
MANVTFEQVLKAVRSLPLEEQRRLRRWLAEEERRRSRQDNDHGHGPTVPRAREMRWLSEHAAEYVGQWVALDGDRLLSHATEARQVYEDAHAAGVQVPFVVYVEAPDEFQWGGWL